MIRFFRWLFGYVEFVFSGGFIDGFVNDCYQQKINIHNIKQSENALFALCLAREYKRLHTVARKHGGTVKITKRKGALFVFLKLRNRLGLVAGAVAFLMIFNLLSSYVWSIEITGNKTLKTPEITNFLAENGFEIGTNWKEVSLPRIENYFMATYDDCAWIHINKKGCKALIEIDEATIPLDTDKASGKFNLKATKDGIITYTNVKRGWDIVKVGSAVTKGDLLASGVYESELNKTNHFTHASGEVIAKTKTPIELTLSRTQTRKILTDETQKKSLILFGITIPLYLGKVPTQNCEITKKYDYIKLNNKNLPIGIETKICKSYTIDQTQLNDKELAKLINLELEKWIKSELGNAEILNKKIDIEIKDNSINAKGEIVALENIAEEVEF